MNSNSNENKLNVKSNNLSENIKINKIDNSHAL